MLIRPVIYDPIRSIYSGVTVGGGVVAWAAALPALRTFITDNYDQPNPHNQAVMVSPPIITVTDNTQPAGLTTEYKYSDGTDTLLRYFGGGNKPNATIFRRFPVATIAATGGNVNDGQNATSWRTSFVADAQKVSISVLDQTENYRFIVDGRYVSLTGTAPAGTGGRCYFQLDFGTKAARSITVEGELAHGFEKVGIAPADAPISAVSTNRRMIVMGDSFIEAIGATKRGDGLAQVAGDMLGILDTWQSGVGGTGYVNTQGGTRFKLSERLGDANTTGPWDVIAVAMGLNDIGLSASAVTSEAETCLSSLRASNPGAQIFVVGPWDTAAPAAPVAGYATTKAAIQAAIPVGAGFVFLDPQGVTYTKSDSTHPDTAGHKTLGDWLALQIKTALGA